jgi:hypothetical protein
VGDGPHAAPHRMSLALHLCRQSGILAEKQAQKLWSPPRLPQLPGTLVVTGPNIVIVFWETEAHRKEAMHPPSSSCPAGWPLQPWAPVPHPSRDTPLPPALPLQGHVERAKFPLNSRVLLGLIMVMQINIYYAIIHLCNC